LLCTAKPRQQKPNQSHVVVEDLFAEDRTSSSVENRQKTEPVPRANAGDIFADTYNSLLKTKPNAGISKPATVTVDDNIFATAPAPSAVKTRHALQSKKSSDVTNAFNIDDDDDDIFAVKPSSFSSVKHPVAATGNTTQKVCHLGL